MRVSIRAVEAADGPAFVQAARASRALHKPWITAPCDAEAFERYLSRFTAPTSFGFVVQLGSGELVGAIHLTNIIYGAFRSGYLGYYGFAGHTGQGLMRQGLQAVVKHAFKDLGLHRVEANIQPGNAASIALVKACGFEQEGYSPAYLKIGGRWRDHERWAKLKR
jgi:ribosomal-protein-alanine N-acetyltransferase